MNHPYGTDDRINKLAQECADAIKSHCLGTIRATLSDACEVARRDTGNAAGALLRDRARALEARAAEHEREEDSEEADLLRSVARELDKLSTEAYALGDPPPKPEPVPDDEIPF